MTKALEGGWKKEARRKDFRRRGSAREEGVKPLNHQNVVVVKKTSFWTRILHMLSVFGNRASKGVIRAIIGLRSISAPNT